jgi:hypothetical protein
VIQDDQAHGQRTQSLDVGPNDTSSKRPWGLLETSSGRADWSLLNDCHYFLH